MLTVIDEFSRTCLTIDVARRLRSKNVLETLADLFIEHRPPEPAPAQEVIAIAVREWLAQISLKTLSIEPGSPWENGYSQSFNRKLRDEVRSGEIFSMRKEAQILIDVWRRHFNTVWPHSALRYRPPIGVQRRRHVVFLIHPATRGGLKDTWPSDGWFGWSLTDSRYRDSFRLNGETSKGTFALPRCAGMRGDVVDLESRITACDLNPPCTSEAMERLGVKPT